MRKTILNGAGVLLIVAVGINVVLQPLSTVHADINSCSVTAAPGSVGPGSNVGVTLTVTNSSSTAIQFLSIGVPTGNFYYTSNNSSSWVSGNPGDGSGVVLNGSSINPGQSENFQIFVNSAVSNEASSGWTVAASDDPNGANPTVCAGSAGTAISGHLPNNVDNGVSNIAVSNIGNSSVTVSWDSNVDTTSLVYYGKTSSYSTWSAHDKAPTSSHVVNLTGLSPGTTYHFQVAGQDDSLNAYYSADGTFVTTGSAPAGSGSQGSIYTPIPIKTTPTEKIPPTITFKTVLKNPYKQPPQIKGSAADNEALAGVEYSMDGGSNWLPADDEPGLGGKKVDFSFTPMNLDDGNYLLLARAIDTSGNTGKTEPITMVIDRLPPLVGGNVVNVGPQIVQPDQDGTIKALIGVDQKITLSAVGGPTSISLEATTITKTKAGSKTVTQIFSLTRSKDTGLWAGVTSFKQPGKYVLTAHAIDGAGNKTERVLNSVYVSSPGRTVDIDTKKAQASTVTVYYQEPESHTWVVWDGAAFGQHNPQQTGRSGVFNLFLPPGKYYVRATAPGYHTFVSDIIEAKQPTPMSTDFTMRPKHGPHLGSHYLSLPSLTVQHVDLTGTTPKDGSQSSLVGKELPNFSLTDTTGATVQPVALLGRPTLISFNSTWAPTTAEQLTVLSKLQANPEFNIVPVALQESSGRVLAYTAIADIKLRWLVDPDSTLSASYNAQSMPLHYFVDRKGVIRQMVVGVLTEKQMLDRLTAL